MNEHLVKRGLDVPLNGRPSSNIVDFLDSACAVVQPREFAGIKQRLLVDVGAVVRRGTPLVEDKQNPAFRICSPAAGRIEAIDRGDRRLVERILIRRDSVDAVEPFGRYTPAQIAGLSRDAVLQQLSASGLLALIRQRPFSMMASAAARPKSIFVNAMATAPFQADAGVAVQADAAGFQAGIDVLKRLTEGRVNLCVGPGAAKELTRVQGAEIHVFHGPHPSGNTSVHISRVDPLRRGEIIWAVKAVDVVQIGRLFLDGALPGTKIVAVGGPGVNPAGRRHYRVRTGAVLDALWKQVLAPGEMRLIAGDVLTGVKMAPEAGLGFFTTAVTVLPEGRDRRLLGWLAPGFGMFSASRTMASAWIHFRNEWSMDTNLNGGRRAMVLTGLYDRVMPLNIMVDFLVKAVLAGDSEEAIQLGILETDPEDFALCDYVCPCKMEIQAVIRKGLEDIQAEEGA